MTRGPGSERPAQLLLYFIRRLRPSALQIGLLVLLILVTAAIPVAFAMLPAAMAQLWTSEPVQLLGATRPGGDWLWLGLRALLVFNIAFLLLQLWQQFMGARVGEDVVLRLRERIFGWLGRRTAFGESPGSIGEAVQRLTGDAQQVRQLIYPGVLMAGIGICQVVYTLLSLLALELWFTLALGVGLVLALLLSGRLHGRLIALATRDRNVNAQLMNQMIEASAGSRDLIAAGRFQHFAKTFDDTSAEKRRLALSTTWWGSLAGSALPYFISMAIGVYYILAVRKCCEPSTAAATIGHTISFAFLLGSLQQPIGQLASFRAQVILAQPAMASLRRATAEPDEHRPATRPSSPRASAWTHIAVSGVTYAYPGATSALLHDVTFEVRRGSFTGIVGESGSGKSTLAHLLLGTLQPTRGTVEVHDGSARLGMQELAEARRVGYIPQQPFIFDMSIRDNVLMGLNPSEVSDADLQRAVDLAQLAPLVERRRQEGGLDAPCGPGGRLLSGGERQRLALARTLLAQPEIIICDEHTANVDAVTALLMQRALSQEFRDRTRIVVSHQLYLLRGADELIVLHHGTVEGRGRHEDLLASCEVYRTFWELQKLG